MSQHPEIKHISEALREGFSLKREALRNPSDLSPKHWERPIPYRSPLNPFKNRLSPRMRTFNTD